MVLQDLKAWSAAEHRACSYVPAGRSWRLIPGLYWRNDCGPDTKWLKFTKDKVPEEIGAFTARDDQRDLHPLISLPGS